MFRFVGFLTALLATVALADPPKFKEGGFNFQIQYGPGFWTMPKAQLEADPAVGVEAGPFVDMLQNTHTVSISAYYNILGHASIGADLTATGWRLTDSTRGGGGFAIGKIAWHPMQLFFLQKDERPFGLDVNTYFGVGYGIVGGPIVSGSSRGMDGLIFEWGFNADYYFTKFFGLGLFARGVFLNWDRYILDYDGKVYAAMGKPLGGSFWTFGLSLTFRGGE